MTGATEQGDLVVLAADKNMSVAVGTLITRTRALGIRSIRSQILINPEHDPGSLRRCHDFLHSYAPNFAHALVLFDREGCGSTAEATALEADAENRLRPVWGDRARDVVIDPELEAWVWSDSPHVDEALGWEGHLPALRDWLILENHCDRHGSKPRNPKSAMEAALRVVRRPRSSAIFAQIAANVSLERCDDRAFLRLRDILSGWFGAPDAGRPDPSAPE